MGCRPNGQPSPPPSSTGTVGRKSAKAHFKACIVIARADIGTRPYRYVRGANACARVAATHPRCVCAGYPQLRELSLARNALTSLTGLEKLPHLKSLNVCFNKIASVDEVHCLRGLSQLTTLDLRLNPVTRVKGYRKLVAEALRSLVTLDCRPIMRPSPSTASAKSRGATTAATNATPVAANATPVAADSVGAGENGHAGASVAHELATLAVSVSSDGDAMFDSPLSPIAVSDDESDDDEVGGSDDGGGGTHVVVAERTPATAASNGGGSPPVASAAVSGVDVHVSVLDSVPGNATMRFDRTEDDGHDSDDVSELGGPRTPSQNDAEMPPAFDRFRPKPSPLPDLNDLGKLSGLTGAELTSMASRFLENPDLQRLAAAHGEAAVGHAPADDDTQAKHTSVARRELLALLKLLQSTPMPVEQRNQLVAAAQRVQVSRGVGVPCAKW